MTFFTDIDVNTTLDVNFKYYDITDLNKMTQPISQKIDFSIMHINIQSLNCHGEKLECLITSTISLKLDLCHYSRIF